ncbi:hypothetical protein NMG60_11037281 [Bertholletia excelsa]
MSCIILPSFPHSNFKKQPYRAPFPCLPSGINQPGRSLYKPKHLFKAKAFTASSLVLCVTTQPKPGGDLSVLLQTGGVMLFAYWITNFVVPRFISKDLQSNQTSEDQKSDGGDPSEAPKTSQGKKRGFNSSKQ